jgi:hypothetical protein
MKDLFDALVDITADTIENNHSPYPMAPGPQSGMIELVHTVNLHDKFSTGSTSAFVSLQIIAALHQHRLEAAVQRINDSLKKSHEQFQLQMGMQ